MGKALYEYQFGKRRGLVLEWNEGWGEIAPLPGFSRETFEEAKGEILTLLPHLENARPKCPSVRFGVFSASTPFLKTPLKVPLCALCVSASSRLCVFALNLSSTFAVQNSRKNLTQRRKDAKTQRGYIKLKLGDLSLEEALSLIKTFQNPLRLDFNRKWPLEKALRFASHFSPTSFDYLEEPVSSLSDLLTFSHLTHFPIAVDESLQETGWEQIPSLKALVIKPTILGHIPNIPPSLDLILSSSYETSLGILQIARLAHPLSKPLGLDTFQDDLLEPPLQKQNGFLIWEPTHAYPIRKDKLCLIATAP